VTPATRGAAPPPGLKWLRKLGILRDTTGPADPATPRVAVKPDAIVTTLTRAVAYRKRQPACRVPLRRCPGMRGAL